MKALFASLSQLLIVLSLVTFCVGSPQPLFGQDQYTAEEYKAYEEVTAENDPVQKVGLVIKFFKQYPKSALSQHVNAAYMQAMNGFQKNQQWNQIINLGEQYVSVNPDDTYTMALLTGAYQQTKSYQRFVAFGEKVFARQPSGNLAYYLTKAYQELGNDAKYLQWGEKTVSLMPNNVEILVELARRTGMAKRNADAAKYSGLCVKALDAATKPEGTPDATWNQYKTSSYATCYAIAGNVAYERNDYANAIKNLESSVRYYKRNDLAYYYLGLSYWQQNKVDIAMLNLAKAFILKGNASASAKQHLDNLYKSTHGQSLVGQDRVIARAQQDLK